MKVLTEFKKLLYGIIRSLILIVMIAALFFVMGPKAIVIRGSEVSVPWFTGTSYAVDFLNKMRNDLVPQDVSLIVTNPFAAFLIEIKIAFFLTLILILPVALFTIMKYLSPALKHNERNALYKVIIPSTLLFYAGCIFAYMFVIPATTKIMYSYTPDIKALPFFNIDDFISLAFTMMTMVGLMFLLPVFMVLSSWLGFIKYAFWKKYWRHAIFAFVVFTAVITPDGTGITMLMLTIPLCVLYISGMLISRRYG